MSRFQDNFRVIPRAAKDDGMDRCASPHAFCRLYVYVAAGQ